MNLTRRHFVSGSMAAVATSLMPNASGALASTAANPSYSDQFDAALVQKPYLSGYRSVTQDHFQSEVRFKGRWPEALRGTLFRNGPAKHEIGDFRYQHWFDGDGMIHAYRLAEGKLQHQARMIETTKYQREQRAGRALYPGFDSIPPNPAPVTSPDLVNVGNISVLNHHGKLLALWEAGSPWAINPDDLTTEGLYEFAPELAGVPFSAHPRVEADGTLWNFGYVSGANLLVLWHIDAAGQVVKMGKITTDPMTIPHDFIVTDKHIVLLLPPFHYEPAAQGGSFLERHQWDESKPTRVLVVDKNDFNSYRWLELPAQWIFHFSNGYEDDQGVIHFDGARAPNPNVMTKNFREVMQGILTEPVTSEYYHYQIDTKRWRVSERPLLSADIDAEFPVIDPRLSTQRHKNVVVMTADASHHAVHKNLNQVSRYNFDTDTLVSYRYPDSQIPEEHLFVPAPGAAPETQGWVIGSAHDWQANATRFNVFDYEALDAGPIASATLPYGMPLGLHGKFVPNS